ncbi:MAG: MASE1 domain-containing protein, partial [Anaerolineae bacterium]|nr:MASE1 domain-containing protein [Anaerolineae bacterium]
MNARLRSFLTAWPITMVLVASLYFLAASLGWAVTTRGDASSPVWPASGIVLGAMILLGYRIWPAILVGEFFASLLYFTSSGTPLPQAAFVALLSGVNSTLEPLVGTWLIRRLIDTPYPFERTKDLGLFA